MVLWVSFVGPHHGGRHERDGPKVKWPTTKTSIWGTTPVPRHWNTFRRLRLPGHPEMWKATDDVAFSGPRRGRVFKAAMREVYRQRIEALQSVDEAVGNAVRKLRRNGQLRNAYVIFTSDNGKLTGHHNRDGKLVAYDRSLRLPLLIRGPGVPKRKRVRTTVPNSKGMVP